MIRINLSASKKGTALAGLSGLDFSAIKVKAVGIAIVLLYLPDFTLIPMLTTEKDNLQQVIASKSTELNRLTRKIEEAKIYEQQIKELQAQEENLSQKLVAVKNAISEKKNPASILLYIAKHTPDDLWITSISIKGTEMTIKGEALSYPAVGSFVSSISDSVFIAGSNIVRTGNKLREADKARIEEFEVKFIIGRFDQ